MLTESEIELLKKSLEEMVSDDVRAEAISALEAQSGAASRR